MAIDYRWMISCILFDLDGTTLQWQIIILLDCYLTHFIVILNVWDSLKYFIWRFIILIDFSFETCGVRNFIIFLFKKSEIQCYTCNPFILVYFFTLMKYLCYAKYIYSFNKKWSRHEQWPVSIAQIFRSLMKPTISDKDYYLKLKHICEQKNKKSCKLANREN